MQHLNSDQAYKIDEACAASGLTGEEFVKALQSEAFGHLLEVHKAKIQEAALNGKAGVWRVVQCVDLAAHPLRDENGPYVQLSCAVCGTKHKVRQLKRGQGKPAKEPSATQQTLPDVEG